MWALPHGLESLLLHPQEPPMQHLRIELLRQDFDAAGPRVLRSE